jgi:hypothetical protein
VTDSLDLGRAFGEMGAFSSPRGYVPWTQRYPMENDSKQNKVYKRRPDRSYLQAHFRRILFGIEARKMTS